jgi:Glycosyl transferase family 2
MRIAAVVGVKDEAEVVERAIAHLRAIGVDHIVACDMHSTDGSSEVLRAHTARDSELRLVSMSDRLTHEEWTRRTLDLVREAEADWVTILDADEFPIPASGSLKECAALDKADVAGIDRYNVPLAPSGPAIPGTLDSGRYGELLLIVEPIPDFWTRIEEDFDMSWMRARINPRVLARPEVIADLPLGAHDVHSPGGTGVRRIKATDVVVAHLPFTTRSRFERKVRNIRAILDAHDDLFGDRYGRHWRRWVALADVGRLDEEFERMVFDEETISELRREGVIRSAAELFGERKGIGA